MNGKDEERDLKIELGKPFRKYVGCRCDVTTPYRGEKGRVFKQIGQVVLIAYDDLYLDCDGTLKAIPLEDIIEIKEVNFEGR